MMTREDCSVNKEPEERVKAIELVKEIEKTITPLVSKFDDEVEDFYMGFPNMELSEKTHILYQSLLDVLGAIGDFLESAGKK